ncbi:unnamed protein product [Amoebophrya sp. A120]|nr:unnamed protein product [Amoebophrya sp. A120]|eukprot:GSA120T00004094001.1
MKKSVVRLESSSSSFRSSSVLKLPRRIRIVLEKSLLVAKSKIRLRHFSREKANMSPVLEASRVEVVEPPKTSVLKDDGIPGALVTEHSRYDILVDEGIIGSGRFTKVRVCRSATLQKSFALKIYDRRVASEVQMPYWGKKGTCSTDVSLADRARYEVKVMKRLLQGEQVSSSGFGASASSSAGMANIARLVEVIDDPACSSFYHVFELVRNGPLLDFCNSRKRWIVPKEAVRDFDKQKPGKDEFYRYSAATTLFALHAMQSGVKYLHLNGVMHKDLAPQNILVHGQFDFIMDLFLTKAKDDEKVLQKLFFEYESPSAATLASVSIKICDFNSCEMLEKPEDDQIWSAEGTMAFRPPEAFGPDVTELGMSGRARDMWSVGVVFFLLIFASLPFDNDFAAAFAMQLRIMNYNGNIDSMLLAWFKNYLASNGSGLASSSTTTSDAEDSETTSAAEGNMLGAEEVSRTGTKKVFLRNCLTTLLEKDPEKRAWASIDVLAS